MILLGSFLIGWLLCVFLGDFLLQFLPCILLNFVLEELLKWSVFNCSFEKSRINLWNLGSYSTVGPSKYRKRSSRLISRPSLIGKADVKDFQTTFRPLRPLIRFLRAMRAPKTISNVKIELKGVKNESFYGQFPWKSQMALKSRLQWTLRAKRLRNYDVLLIIAQKLGDIQ